MKRARSSSCIVVHGRRAVEALANGWDETVLANPHSTVFQTSHWYKAWLETVAPSECAEPVLLILPGRAGVALQINRFSENAPTFRPLSSPWADYHEAVGHVADTEAIAMLALAMRDMVQSSGYRLILNEIVPGGMLAAICRQLGWRMEPSSPTFAIDLTNQKHVNGILGRSEHLIKRRRLSRLGKVRCDHYTRTDEVLSRLPCFIAMHKRQWGGRADAIAPFDGNVVDCAFKTMVEQLAPQKMVMLSELLVDATPIAMYFGFLFNGRYLAYRTSFDALYKRFSPGHNMLRQMIVDFRSQGLSELDLMRDACPYKKEYADRVSCNFEVQIAPHQTPDHE